MAITKKAIQSAIATFTTSRDKLQMSAHTIAMMIFQHAAPKEVSSDCDGTGDCTLAVTLVQQLPTSWGTQMVTWFKAFTPIVMNVKTGRCEYSAEYKALGTPEEKLECWNIEGANTTPYFKLSDETPVKNDVFDIEALIKYVGQLVKKAEKAEKDGRIPADKKDATLKAIARLRALDLIGTPAIASNDQEQSVAA